MLEEDFTVTLNKISADFSKQAVEKELGQFSGNCKTLYKHWKFILCWKAFEKRCFVFQLLT